MHWITAWCGFLGAWVLVAGPVYQGAVELAEVEVDRQAIRSQAETVARPGHFSPWWWLVPPVAYVKSSRIQNVWQQQVMASLTHTRLCPASRWTQSGMANRGRL